MTTPARDDCSLDRYVGSSVHLVILSSVVGEGQEGGSCGGS
jgi:hypothetical protein